MKIALCLSGQPRNYRDSFFYIYKHIIENNDVDVFFHTWFDKENRYMEKSHMDRGNCEMLETTIEELLFLYKPKDYLVEKPRNFIKPNLLINEKRLKGCMSQNAHKNWSDEECKAHVIKQHCSMFYSIFKANEMKENFANQHGIVYDFVVRLRFDCVPLTPIKFELYDPNYLHYHDMGHPDEIISDWINFGSNRIMNIYSSIYLHLEYLNTFQYYKKEERIPNTLEPSDECGGMYEHTIRDMITLHKIPYRKVGLNCILTPNS